MFSLFVILSKDPISLHIFFSRFGDNGSQMRRFMKSAEAYMGRPDKFDLTPQEFDDILSDYFEIVKTESIDSVAMIQYFVTGQTP